MTDKLRNPVFYHYFPIRLSPFQPVLNRDRISFVIKSTIYKGAAIIILIGSRNGARLFSQVIPISYHAFRKTLPDRILFSRKIQNKIGPGRGWCSAGGCDAFPYLPQCKINIVANMPRAVICFFLKQILQYLMLIICLFCHKFSPYNRHFTSTQASKARLFLPYHSSPASSALGAIFLTFRDMRQAIPKAIRINPTPAAAI